jgi:hypothetical protein
MKTPESQTVPTHVLEGIQNNNLNMASHIRAEWEIEGVVPLAVARELDDRAAGELNITFDLPPFPVHVEGKIRENETALYNAVSAKMEVNFKAVSEEAKLATTRLAVNQERAAKRQLEIIKSEWLVDSD